MSTTIRIQNFSGGIAEDIRTTDSGKYAGTKHFDTALFDRKLQPHRAWTTDETFDSGAKTDALVKFLIEPETGRLYGYGKNAGGSNQPKLYRKTSNDITANWTTIVNGTTATSGARNINMFVAYQGNIHGWRGSQYVWQYDVSGDTFTNSKLSASASWSFASEGLIHAQDASLLFGHDNFLSRIKDGTATEKVLTLSQDHFIADLDQKGIYVLIGMAPLNTAGNSYLAIWDTSDSASTPIPQETIDLGEGVVKYVGNIDGTIVAIMETGFSSYVNTRLVVKQIIGNAAIEVSSLDLNDLDATVSVPTKTYDGASLLFPIASSVDNENTCLVRVGKRKLTNEIIMTCDRRLAVDSIQGVASSLGIVWLGHSGDGSIERTNTGATYDNSLTTIYESLVNHGMAPLDREANKQLEKVLINTEPLPTNGTVTLKYKTEHDTSWQTFSPSVTNSTDNAVVTEFTPNIRGFYEIQFRIEGVGGAVVTGMSYRYKKLASK